MAMKGMDVDAGKDASTQIKQGSSDLTELTQRMSGVIKGFDWIGPDADRTRDSWDHDYVGMLTKVSQQLEEFSTLIQNQAQEQESTSN